VPKALLWMWMYSDVMYYVVEYNLFMYE